MREHYNEVDFQIKYAESISRNKVAMRSLYVGILSTHNKDFSQFGVKLKIQFSLPRTRNEETN